MSSYYNEIDAGAAAWLRELIKRGLIADGTVDTRSIDDVIPSDLAGFTQCHFFAGIGGWSCALRLAGWPDDRHAWTASCPCQPFSTAGKGAGTADERHLWPALYHLIAERRPGVLFGEQVEAAINHGWLSLVQDDLEGEGYTFGAVGLPAACVGAPHIRQRLWFVADADATRPRINRGTGLQGDRDAPCRNDTNGRRTVGGLGHADSARLALRVRVAGDDGAASGAAEREAAIAAGSPMEYPTSVRWVEWRPESGWRGAELRCGSDGRSRPIEPGLEPLAYGVPARVGRLRGYGNAIVPQVAAEVIAAYMEIAA